MHHRGESAIYRYSRVHGLLHRILRTASTLQILNLAAWIPPHTERAFPRGFFEKMSVLRAFRCDNDIIMPNIQPLEYLSVGEWTLEGVLDDNPSMAIGELFVRDISLFPILYPESKHLHRLNLDITPLLPTLRDAFDVLPPTVTYLSIIVGRWEDVRGRIRIQRLPASVTTLGLEAGEVHCKDRSYRHLVNECRDIIAPGLTVVQLNNWQTCVDLRTRHPGLLKEFVEMLGNRNVELWDSEGFVMEGTAL
ncbi:hypothetical protein ONZ45_g18573 [Pleurotus djamor]|nr:hypothetical protein ONZ45_g18573 [Pleurotus djamor]